MGDEDHLGAASSTGRILFTYNTADYCALHQRWISLKRSHAGIIVARQQQYSVGEELRRIMQLISRRTAEQMQNRLEFVSSWAALSRLDLATIFGDHVRVTRINHGPSAGGTLLGK
jgi:hypothetical protein